MAIAAALVAVGIRLVLPFHAPLLVGPCVLIPYGVLYLFATERMGIASMGAMSRLLGRRR